MFFITNATVLKDIQIPDIILLSSQMDMQELIEEQMRSKMINNRKTQQTEPQTNTSGASNLAKRLSNYKLWSLFQR